MGNDYNLKSQEYIILFADMTYKQAISPQSGHAFILVSFTTLFRLLRTLAAHPCGILESRTFFPLFLLNFGHMNEVLRCEKEPDV